MVLAVGAPGSVPDDAAEVPEVGGAVVGDEEDLAVDLLVVEGLGGGGVGEQQGAGGEEVRVGNVLHVREVEQVVIVAQLHARLAREVGVDDVVQGHGVSLAHDAGGADRGGQEPGVVSPVGFDDYLLGSGLLYIFSSLT